MKQEIKSSKTKNNSLPLIIGCFDVIHKQHKKLFDKVKPNSFNVLLIINSPNKGEYVHPLDLRINIIQQLQPNTIYIFDVNKNNVSAEHFIQNYLIPINPSKTVIGSDFKFGKNLKGNVKLLEKHFTVDVIKYNDNYQTKKIKSMYKNGLVWEANQFLYWPILIKEKVIKCKQEGRKLGFPTLNIFLKDKKQIQFKEGVYVSLCVLNNIIFNSVTCIFKPTVRNGQLIETNIIVDYPKGYNAYGKEIKIMLISYLTPFIKFKHRNDLKKYISDNVKLTKKYFGI